MNGLPLGMHLQPLAYHAPESQLPLRYFISDLHLDGGDTPRAQKFRYFLEKLSEAAQHGPVELYIVGDLFEFWYEYRKQLFEIYARDLEALENAWHSGVIPSRVKIVTYEGTTYVMGILTPEEQAAVTEKVSTTAGVQKVVTLYQTYIQQP